MLCYVTRLPATSFAAGGVKQKALRAQHEPQLHNTQTPAETYLFN